MCGSVHPITGLNGEVLERVQRRCTRMLPGLEGIKKHSHDGNVTMKEN